MSVFDLSLNLAPINSCFFLFCMFAFYSIFVAVVFQIRCRDIEKKEAKVKYINKLGQEITAESLDTTLTDGVEEKLVTLNKKWRDTREILSDYHGKDEDEHSEFGSCCCFQMIKKAFQACFYS